MAFPIPPIDEGGGTGSGSVPSPPGTNGTTESGAITGRNLREGSNILFRPSVLTSVHLYNLRNQTWATPVPEWAGNDYPKDTLSQFRSRVSAFPSNADETNPFIYAQTDNTAGSKTIQRFNSQDAVTNTTGSTPAAMGYFIIDALDRGTSRLDEASKLKDRQPSLVYAVDTLPRDESPDGASCVCEFSGRIFYSGFTGRIIDGDTSSPKLSSYVMFSQLVTDSLSSVACYQQADPTSKDISSLVDTDGGVIRVQGAFNIIALINIGSGLAVLAENGCWVISGGNGYGFTATNYKITKVSSAGCISSGSVVAVESAVLYWGQDGIYNLSTNQYGDFVADNIARKTIQTFYNAIPIEDKASSEGGYDSYEKKVKWVYGNSLIDSTQVREITIDMNLGAFYKSSFGIISAGKFPSPYSIVSTQPFILTGSADIVVNSGDLVLNSSDQVTTLNSSVSESSKDSKYLIITDVSGNIKYTFGYYKDQDHYDWRSYNGAGVDAKSYLLTGVLAGGDFQRKKTVVSLTTHFTKTEDGFVQDVNDDWVLKNQSSCLTQVQWDWTNNANSGKWGRKFQAYRLRRPWMPATLDEGFDNGYYVTETKNRIRGSGKALSVLFESEPGKHLHLLGWSVTIGTDGNV